MWDLLNQDPLLLESIHLVSILSLMIFMEKDICIYQHAGSVHRYNLSLSPAKACDGSAFGKQVC